MPNAPLTVPPGTVVPPDRIADAAAVIDREPAAVVNVTVVSTAFAGTAVITATTITPAQDTAR